MHIDCDEGWSLLMFTVDGFFRKGTRKPPIAMPRDSVNGPAK
jgi:hypothetical protein